jgi:hypothetical protein
VSELKQDSNKIINFHLIFSLAISALLYFFYEQFFAISFLAGSAAMNLYLRLLQNAFWLSFAAKLNFDVENKTLLIIFSAFRALLIAGLFTYFILKLKFNLIALGTSFICYNIIVIAGAVFFNPAFKNNNN